MNTSTAQPDSETTLLYQFTEFAKLKPHSVIVHKRWENTVATQENIKSLSNLAKGNQYNGYMSDASRRKVKGLIENYLTAVQLSTTLDFPKSFPSEAVYPTFLTLTLPCKQMQCDNTIKKECFFRFLEYLQGDKEKSLSGWNVKNYIWTAETQKNGNIHFHVILDRGIPADRLNQVWNRFLNRLDYVENFRARQEYIYQDGFYVRPDMLKNAIEAKATYHRRAGLPGKFNRAKAAKDERIRQKKAYENGVAANWSNPPTTKIHAIQNIKKLTAYVSKYMTKEATPVTKLPEGEKLVKKDGKWMACGVEEQRQVRMERMPNGIIGESYEIVRIPYEYEVSVTFDVRRLRGRIWGCSKALHCEDLSPLQIAMETTAKYKTVTYTPAIRKTEVWRAKLDLFGQQYSVKEVVEDSYTLIQEKEHWLEPVKDPDALKYIAELRKAVPAEDIRAATAKAGDMFAAYGEIIPLKTAQKDLLPAISPPIWIRYKAHYNQMYQVLYPDDAANKVHHA